MIKPLSSPSALAERVDTALELCPYCLRDGMDFETEEGLVVLRGEVQTYYQKQMVQETVRRLDGVDQIENHLIVNWA